MSDKLIIGIDNGVTGTIACKDGNNVTFFLTPVKKEQNYVKKKDLINRVDVNELKRKLSSAMVAAGKQPQECLAILERPLVNPTRFKATLSAIRALEATICVLENLNLPYMYIDSREWQREILPKGCEGEELKKVSADIGCRLYPQWVELIRKHKDADGLLIAHWGSLHF